MNILNESVTKYFLLTIMSIFAAVMIVAPARAEKAASSGERSHLDIPYHKVDIEIDGKLDESVWDKAIHIDKFFSTTKNDELTQRTEVKIFHDSENIYFGIINHEEKMEDLWELAFVHDDEVWLGDDVEVYLSPGEHKGEEQYPYYQFLLSASGVQADLKAEESGETDLDWDADWEAATHQEENRWTAEIAIPLASMDEKGNSIWRANVTRMEKPHDEKSTLVPLKGIFAQPKLFGVWRLVEY